MASNVAPASLPEIRIRKAEQRDLDALINLEQRVFSTDQLSRRSLAHMLRSRSAHVLVAESGEKLAGTAGLLFRRGSVVARLYSLAVAPHMSGRGVAPMLLEAAERVALERGCRTIRLEVHASNHAAIARYRKSRYREFGRLARYYEDGGDAVRFQKALFPKLPRGTRLPRYFHQTTEFTCGPACM